MNRAIQNALPWKLLHGFLTIASNTHSFYLSISLSLFLSLYLTLTLSISLSLTHSLYLSLMHTINVSSQSVYHFKETCASLKLLS